MSLAAKGGHVPAMEVVCFQGWCEGLGARSSAPLLYLPPGSLTTTVQVAKLPEQGPGSLLARNPCLNPSWEDIDPNVPGGRCDLIVKTTEK